MPDVVSRSADVLLSRGLSGVIILILLVAVWRLFNLYVHVQEKRIEEGKASKEALLLSKQSLDTLTRVVESQRGQQ